MGNEAFNRSAVRFCEAFDKHMSPRLPVPALERADRTGLHVPAVVPAGTPLQTPSVMENDVAFGLRIFQRDSLCFMGQKLCCLESSLQQLILKHLGHFLLPSQHLQG